MVDGMSTTRIIPKTDIMGRYRDLRGMSQAKRLSHARRLVEHPEELATESAASVAHFAPYSNLDEQFYPERPERHYSEDFKNTNDVVLRLKEQKQVIPVDAPDRAIGRDAGPTVTAVLASALASTYVDRELLVQRTTSPAKWEDGKRNLGGVRLDVLLADVADRTPIVAELKLPGDMDPFFALVQALACAAHLATPNQYERMRRRPGGGQFPRLDGAPRLDVWVLFVDAADRRAGQPPKGAYMADLEHAAEALAPRLLAEDALTDSIRRIAGLGLRKLDGSDEVAADVRWAWERTGA